MKDKQSEEQSNLEIKLQSHDYLVAALDEYPAKVHVIRAWYPQWCQWVVVESLEHVA